MGVSSMQIFVQSISIQFILLACWIVSFFHFFTGSTKYCLQKWILYESKERFFFVILNLKSSMASFVPPSRNRFFVNKHISIPFFIKMAMKFKIRMIYPNGNTGFYNIKRRRSPSRCNYFRSCFCAFDSDVEVDLYCIVFDQSDVVEKLTFSDVTFSTTSFLSKATQYYKSISW